MEVGIGGGVGQRVSEEHSDFKVIYWSVVDRTKNYMYLL